MRFSTVGRSRGYWPQRKCQKVFVQMEVDFAHQVLKTQHLQTHLPRPEEGLKEVNRSHFGGPLLRNASIAKIDCCAITLAMNRSNEMSS